MQLPSLGLLGAAVSPLPMQPVKDHHQIKPAIPYRYTLRSVARLVRLRGWVEITENEPEISLTICNHWRYVLRIDIYIRRLVSISIEGHNGCLPDQNRQGNIYT